MILYEPDGVLVCLHFPVVSGRPAGLELELRPLFFWRYHMKLTRLSCCALLAIPLLSATAFAAEQAGKNPDWSMKATIIEACSCPMFCQCYFDDKPAAHAGGEHAQHGGSEH